MPRGKRLHNNLIARICEILLRIGCIVTTEFRVPTQSGGYTDVDIHAELAGIKLIVEIETTLRNLVSNAKRGIDTGLHFFIVVHNRKLRDAGIRKLKRHNISVNNFPKIMLISGIEREKHNVFPISAPAIVQREIKEIRKLNQN